MSKALDYLQAVRPEAMGAYFGFLREAGRHLDPRTRALISVITKAATQTETGFRQYLKRALQAGVTPDEILDGLLLAFPILGLTKVVWAVDQLLALDLPQFRPEALRAPARWHDLGPEGAFEPGRVHRVEVEEGRGLLVRRSAEGWTVFEARCPHQGTELPAPAAEVAVIECPGHGWRFDPLTGACLSGGDRPLRRLECRLVAGRLEAHW